MMPTVVWLGRTLFYLTITFWPILCYRAKPSEDTISVMHRPIPGSGALGSGPESNNRSGSPAPGLPGSGLPGARRGGGPPPGWLGWGVSLISARDIFFDIPSQCLMDARKSVRWSKDSLNPAEIAVVHPRRR